MTFDWKWFDTFLKTSGPKTAAVAFACGAFLLVAHWNWIPPLDRLVVQAVWFALLLTASLSVSSIASSVNGFLQPRVWIVRWSKLRSERHAVRDYIPHMQDREREIIGYLLAKNQKMFSAEADGGYAAPLLSRGIVRIAVRPNQHVALMDVPMVIPDHIWEVLVEHKDQFPNTPPKKGDAHPWRVPMI